MLVALPSGEGVELHSRPRAGRLTADQVRARRNDDWRIDHEIGRYDPETGRLVRRPVALIALLAGVSVRCVQLGIADARRNREAIALAN